MNILNCLSLILIACIYILVRNKRFYAFTCIWLKYVSLFTFLKAFLANDQSKIICIKFNVLRDKGYAKGGNKICDITDKINCRNYENNRKTRFSFCEICVTIETLGYATHTNQ